MQDFKLSSWIPRALLIGLLLLSFKVLQEFLSTLTWSLIIAYITWPLFQWLNSKLSGRSNLSAALITVLLAIILALISVGLADMLRTELSHSYQALASNFTQDLQQLPSGITNIPWLGPYLQEKIAQLSNDQSGLIAQIQTQAQRSLGYVAGFLGSIGESLLKLGVILVTVFFCLRDGESAVRQLRLGLISFLGPDQNLYLQAIAQTTRAVVYGLVLAAMAQGVLAGIGYSVAGIQAPLLFGVLTAILAIVPMGATLVWLPLGLLLLLTNQYWQGIGLLLWGFLAVSTIDNVIRPLVISGASRVPLLVVMLGVLGGLSAFGGVGLFLGPVVLAVLLAVWQAWLKQQDPTAKHE